MNKQIHKSTQKKMERQMKAEETLNRFLNDETLFLHHQSLLAGSIAKNSGGIVSKYNGRFGTGFAVDLPYWGKNGSGKFHTRYYFIKKNK